MSKYERGCDIPADVRLARSYQDCFDLHTLPPQAYLDQLRAISDQMCVVERDPGANPLMEKRAEFLKLLGTSQLKSERRNIALERHQLITPHPTRALTGKRIIPATNKLLQTLGSDASTQPDEISQMKLQYEAVTLNQNLKKQLRGRDRIAEYINNILDHESHENVVVRRMEARSTAKGVDVVCMFQSGNEECVLSIPCSRETVIPAIVIYELVQSACLVRRRVVEAMGLSPSIPRQTEGELRLYGGDTGDGDHTPHMQVDFVSGIERPIVSPVVLHTVMQCGKMIMQNMISGRGMGVTLGGGDVSKIPFIAPSQNAAVSRRSQKQSSR